jgi:hypothetical protein
MEKFIFEWDRDGSTRNRMETIQHILVYGFDVGFQLNLLEIVSGMEGCMETDLLQISAHLMLFFSEDKTLALM